MRRRLVVCKAWLWTSPIWAFGAARTVVMMLGVLTQLAVANGDLRDRRQLGLGGRARFLRLDAPVLMSPKRYTDTLPARLRTRPVVDPCPLWCWSLVTRADDDRETIAALREHARTVAQTAALHTVPAAPTWLPSRDPHRDEITSPRA